MATATAEKQKKDSTEVLDLKNFIDGEFVDPAEGETEDVLNPATGEVIAEAPLSTEEDVDRAVKAARKAFETWQTTTPGERAAAAAEARRRDRGARRGDRRLETGDAGKPRQAMFEDEIPPMVDQLRFFAGAARMHRGPGRRRVHGGPHLAHPPRAGRRRRPDHPLELPADDGRSGRSARRSPTGNTLVLKPAETTPVTTLKILAELAADDPSRRASST